MPRNPTIIRLIALICLYFVTKIALPAHAQDPPTIGFNSGAYLSNSWVSQQNDAYRMRLKRELNAAVQLKKAETGLQLFRGIVEVRVSLDPQGKIVSHRIIRGTGYATLDARITEILTSINNLPPFPAEYQKKTPLTLDVPLLFKAKSQVRR